MTRPPPAPGPPWDAPLDEAALAFVDLEMTGLDPATDHVIEVCIERVVGGHVVDSMCSLVKPPVRAGHNVHIHGIDEAALTHAPPFADLAGRVLALLSDAVLVAHGARWDVSFLEAELARVGAPQRFSHYLDTLDLSRRALSLPRHSLDALAEHLGIDRARAHRADADVAALRTVFAECVRILAPNTPRDLWEVRIAERAARSQVLADCTDAQAAGVPVRIDYRPRGRAAETLTMVVTAVDSGLDPPRVIGYLLPGRGRRELRADRILRVESAQ
ncbi:MAG: 3'-5' exonuclease [Myxococcales bacterium]|nr:3'-5' exonuclease [Myxococcales bacterium]